MSQLTQVCYSCRKELPFSAFHKKKTNPSGYKRICKECARVERKKYYDTHKEKEFANHKKYVNENKEKVYTRIKIQRKESPTYFKRVKERRAERRQSDIGYYVFHRTRYRIGRALQLRKIRSGITTREMLGISNDEYIKYLESTFTEGMTWEKYRSGELQIDHIIPCVCFDLTKESHQRVCFNYRNTRMLFSSENLGKKNNKWLSPEEIERYVSEVLDL